MHVRLFVCVYVCISVCTNITGKYGSDTQLYTDFVYAHMHMHRTCMPRKIRRNHIHIHECTCLGRRLITYTYTNARVGRFQHIIGLCGLRENGYCITRTCHICKHAQLLYVPTHACVDQRMYRFEYVYMHIYIHTYIYIYIYISCIPFLWTSTRICGPATVWV